MNTIEEYKVREFLFKNNIISNLKDVSVNIEISNPLDKNRIISLHQAKLNIPQNISTKKLYLKLIDSLKNYSGKNILLVFVIRKSIQETYFIDEDLKSVLCHW